MSTRLPGPLDDLPVDVPPHAREHLTVFVEHYRRERDGGADPILARSRATLAALRRAPWSAPNAAHVRANLAARAEDTRP
jgi:hypothetical protein